jgi:DnaJ-class molecular chaperone
METDTRIVTCDACNGDGGFESMPYGYNHINGSPLTHWNKCTACDGHGEIEVKTEPVEMDGDQEG